MRRTTTVTFFAMAAGVCLAAGLVAAPSFVITPLVTLDGNSEPAVAIRDRRGRRPITPA